MMVMKTARMYMSLLILVSLSAGVTAAADKEMVSAPDTNAVSITAGHKIVVYYLYFKPRCETCLNMEAFSKEAIETGFANELKQGLVEWHAYDVDSSAYKHYWDDFKLDTKALVMVEWREGKQVRWKNCTKIWDLATVKPDFMKYVQDEVRSYLSANADSTASHTH
jgi:hypothetical protein